MTYVQESRRNTVVDMPVSLPQTELRRGNELLLASVPLALGQRLSVRALTLSLLKILSSGSAPDRINTPQGLCSVGVYVGEMLCTPLCLVVAGQVGTAALNAFAPREFVTPGLYTVRVFNNTGRVTGHAVDLSVTATGVLKLYL
jgi:hypothetical protein